MAKNKKKCNIHLLFTKFWYDALLDTVKLIHDRSNLTRHNIPHAYRHYHNVRRKVHVAIPFTLNYKPTPGGH